MLKQEPETEIIISKIFDEIEKVEERSGGKDKNRLIGEIEKALNKIKKENPQPEPEVELLISRIEKGLEESRIDPKISNMKDIIGRME